MTDNELPNKKWVTTQLNGLTAMHQQQRTSTFLFLSVSAQHMEWCDIATQTEHKIRMHIKLAIFNFNDANSEVQNSHVTNNLRRLHTKSEKSVH